jgi:hypothetical protein
MRYVDAEVSYWHSALLRSDGQLLVFGDNSNGQLNVPALPAGLQYTGVALSSSHTVALRSDGQAVAFGGMWGGQNIPPLPPGQTYTQVDAAYTQTLLLRSDGAIVHMGDTLTGQANVPALPPGIVYTDLASSQFYNAALRSDGSAVAWGSTSSTNWATHPPLPSGVYYVEADGGGYHTILRRSDGEVDVLGYIANQVMGVPPPLDPGTSYVEVSANAHNISAARVGPTSTYVGFAAGCAGTMPATRLVPSDTPRIDATLRVRLFDLPQDVAFMVMGFQRQSPASLLPVGMPGCFQHVAVDAFLLLQGQDHQAVWELPVPNWIGLVGVHFYNQALVLDQTANWPGAVVSDAAEGVIGHW